MGRPEYSAFHSPFWKTFKRQNRVHTQEAYLKNFGEIFEQSRFWNETPRDIQQGTYVEYCANLAYRFKKITHYFIDAGLQSFLVKSLDGVTLTTEHCKRLPGAIIDPFMYVDAQHTEVSSQDPYKECNEALMTSIERCFVMHFPAKERFDSIVVFPDFYIPAINKSSCNQLCLERFYFSATNGIDIINYIPGTAYLTQSDVWEKGRADLIQLLLGFSLYVDAFPDAIKPATADDFAHPKQYQGEQIMVHGNEASKEEAQNGVSPHWRRGHYRLLTSDRFTRKRGLTVYVRGTYVKGIAQVVEM